MEGYICEKYSVYMGAIPEKRIQIRNVLKISLFIVLNPYQPRKSFTIDSLEEMAQSIRQYGVIQPITVRKVAQDGYELITGERRLRAAKLAGLDYIPAIIMNAYEQD